MTVKLTQGEKNRRANIRSLKALGAKNAKIRAAAKVEAYLAHVDRNNAVAEQAAAARTKRIAEGQAKRDLHNAMLARAAARRRVEEVMATDMDAAMEMVAQGAPMPILEPGAQIAMIGANDQMDLPKAA